MSEVININTDVTLDNAVTNVPPPTEGKKGNGFNINTFNPMLFMTQFGLDQIQLNMESMNTASLQLQAQEKFEDMVNQSLNDLVNKTMPEQKTLSGWGKFVRTLSFLNAYSAIVEIVRGKGNPYSSKFGPDWMMSDSPDAGDQQKDSSMQYALNSASTTANNNISSTMKLGIDNASENDTQLAQMISNQLSTLQQVMSVRVYG